MTSFPFPYIYLIMSLVLLGVFIVAFYISPERQRKPMMLSGLLSIPWSLASISFVPDYWHPERVVTFLTGFEDIIFSFANGGTVWLFSIWFFRDSFLLNLRIANILKRYIVCSIFGITVRFVSKRLGIGVMTSTIIAIVVLGVLLIAIQRNVWPLTLTGMSAFTAIYTTVLFIIFTIQPEFIWQWNNENLWGISVIGIPLEEIVWAAAYGGVWPILMTYVFNLKWCK